VDSCFSGFRERSFMVTLGYLRLPWVTLGGPKVTLGGRWVTGNGGEKGVMRA